MAPIRLDFGYYPEAMDLSVGSIKIETLPGLEDKVRTMESDRQVHDGWIYAPPQQVQHLGGGISKRPYPTRVFGLPHTHAIKHSSPSNRDHVVFHVWALSFFCGMRLTTTEAGFVDATPIKPGRLVDFVLGDQTLPKAVSLAESFWLANRANPERAKLFAAVVHALFMGQCRLKLQFEQFLLLYTAFDACFALAKSLQSAQNAVVQGLKKGGNKGGQKGAGATVPHKERVSWMCKKFGVPVPAWADPAASPTAMVADVRNQTVHEALFMGEPLGFAVHGIGTGQNLPLEMTHLICRLLLALLGADSSAKEYLTSPATTQQLFALQL